MEYKLFFLINQQWMWGKNGTPNLILALNVLTILISCVNWMYYK